MIIRLAEIEEIKRLTQISKEAFDSDVDVGGKQNGGPPFYDSESWHEQMRNSGNLYSAFGEDELIGGAIMFCDDNSNSVYVGRIFVAPSYHHRGYGIEMMHKLEEMFSDKAVFKLDTPIWNVRTNRFYAKLGYVETRRDDEFVSYEKNMCKA